VTAAVALHGARRSGFFRGGCVALLIVVVLLSGIPGGLAPASAATSSPPGAERSAVAPSTSARHAPAMGLGTERRLAEPRPAQGDELYTQEGATIAQINGTSATGVPELSEYVRLRNSPYSTAYELNGLTNSGDWWQVTVGDNWPGCNSGFEELSEIWGVGDVGQPVTCSPNVTLSAGDLVELTLSFHASEGCLGLVDLTTSSNYTYCASQPDSGGKDWEFLDTSSNSDGYYTGPMTEVINLTISNCPDNTLTPRMEYLYSSGTHVTEYTPWSDEFDLATGATCYTSSDSEQTISPGDPASYYVDTATGTSYGPHWVGGQNYSMLNASYGFRFETDADPMTGVTLSANPTTVSRGASVEFNLSVGGGTAPYRALWTLNDVLQNLTTTVWNWTAGPTGKYAVTGYGVDHDDSVAGPSNLVTVTVPGPLAVSPITAVPSSGIDVGGTVTFSVHVSGGYGYDVLAWSSLPTGCVSGNASTVDCTPTGSGAANVSVLVRDENGSEVDAGPIAYTVYPTLTATLNGSAQTLDLGQSVVVRENITGGSGGTRSTWSIPSTCAANQTELNCTPLATGPEYLSVSVTDSTGRTVVAGLVLNVNPDLDLYVPAPRVLTDAGVPFSAHVVVDGGTAPFVYRWSGLPTGCTPTGPVANCTTSTAGALTLALEVTDATGASARSPSITVDAAAAPSVTVSVTGSPDLVGSALTLTATPQGGTAPFAYAWSGLPAGCTSQNDPTLVCAPTSAGNFSVEVHATDSDGANATATVSVSVTPLPPATGTSGTGLSLLDWLAIGLVGGSIIAAVAAVAWRRRYK
jgi:hypothetical protein